MIEIPLTQGQTALIDDIDADLTEFNWYAQYNPKTSSFYAERTSGSIVRVSIKMHRLVMQRILGRTLNKLEIVDHIHHNTLDNRRSEIRIATPSQNAQNRRITASNSSGYKGVSWDKSTDKWKAEIRHDKQYYYLGVFSDIEDAREAYDRKALELHGEYRYKE